MRPSCDARMLEASFARAGAAVHEQCEREAAAASAPKPRRRCLHVHFTADEDTCKRILAFIASQPTVSRGYRFYESGGERPCGR